MIFLLSICLTVNGVALKDKVVITTTAQVSLRYIALELILQRTEWHVFVFWISALADFKHSSVTLECAK